MLEARLKLPIPGFWSFPARAALHTIVGGEQEHLLLLSNGRMARVSFRYLTERGHERYKSMRSHKIKLLGRMQRIALLDRSLVIGQQTTVDI
jgi:hypothetical protein